ncbi:MAG: AAA family ATPase, partial [Dehalococcoidia bacterium]|nr:AAA family ATPase [Dehalococcoidia bacterium]
MRFERLILKAYGAYSGRTLDFASTPDFHVVYGPNEAGKSTTLRALIALLFGIDERTPDRFRFGYEALRIGAVLRAADGRELALMRRKGRKSTLAEMDPVTLAERGTPVPEAALAKMLGGLTESLYTHLVGLDYDRLVEGGRALVEGKGEVGASLFEAGAGLASVRALRARLAGEAEALFKPRASTPELNRTLRAYEDARREARERAVRGSDWQQRQKAVEEATARHRKAREEHERLLGEARRLARLHDLLPLAAQRTVVQQRLD